MVNRHNLDIWSLMDAEAPKKSNRCELWTAIGLSLFAALAFYFSTNPTLRDLDYTTEIASAFLRGDLGLREKPPEWLNEMIPYGNKYYSAFPLGAVISMVPIALLQKMSLIHNFPASILDALIAGVCVYFFFQLAKALGPRVLQPQTTTTGPADFTGAVSNFWNLDLVQSWNRWRLANRSGSGVTGRNRGSLFYVGAAVAFHRGRVFHACFWKPH